MEVRIISPFHNIMSFYYTGSASNITTGSLMTLTGTATNSTGSITLSNVVVSPSGFLSRFCLSNANQGSVTYSFGDQTNQIQVGLNGSSNTISLYYNNSVLTSGANTFTASNSVIAIKYNPSSSNTGIKVYVNSTTPSLSFVSGTTYPFSSLNNTHSWTGSNTVGTPIRIGTPCVENIASVNNSLSVSDSLMVKNNSTINGNLTVGGTTNAGLTIISSGGATLGSMNINSMGLNSAQFCGFNHYAQPSTVSSYGVLVDNNGNTYLNASTSNNIISFRQSNVEQARIDSGGALLTSSLSNQGNMQTSYLTVANTIYVTGIQASYGITCGNIASTTIANNGTISSSNAITSVAGTSQFASLKATGTVQFNNSRHFGVCYFLTTNLTISSYTLPKSFPFPNYFAPYSSSQSCIGSDFSSFSTSAQSFTAPATGLYQWECFILSPLAWYMNGLSVPNGSVFKGYSLLSAGATLYPQTATYTSTPSSVQVSANSYFIISLFRESY